MNIDFKRATKIWWSFIWRACLMMMVISFAVAPLMFRLIPKLPGPDSNPLQSPWFMMGWIGFMTLSFAIQCLAMRFALNVKWADFRLVAVPIEKVDAN